MMDDPEDEKPEDWDQAEQIVDPEAEKPDDWDDEDDGEWEAPMIPNPDYKGAWKHPQIPNPDWVEVVDPQKRKPINFVAFDLWQVKSGTLFSNMLITDNAEEAKAARWTEDQHEAEKEAKTAYDKAQEPPEEEEDDEEDAEDADEEEDLAELDEEEGEGDEPAGHDEL